MASGETEAAYRYSVQAGDEAVAVFAVEDAIGHYEQARSLLQEQSCMTAGLGGRTPLRPPGAGLCLPERLAAGPRGL